MTGNHSPMTNPASSQRTTYREGSRTWWMASCPLTRDFQSAAILKEAMNHAYSQIDLYISDVLPR